MLAGIPDRHHVPRHLTAGNGVLTWKLRTPLSLVITAVSPRIPALMRGESRSVFSRASWSSLLASATTTRRVEFHGER